MVIRRIRPVDAVFLALIAAVTAALLWGLPATGYLREPSPDNLPMTVGNIATFLVFDLLWIGLPVALHTGAVRDYGRLNRVWLFSIWGGITGAFLGEIALGASPVLIIPYTILMVIYAHLYKRFAWWKVASTTYLAGMAIENGLNRAPIQAPTLMWVGFFVAPYFVAKIAENRRMIAVRGMLRASVRPALAGVVFGTLAWVVTRSNPSPPLIFAGAITPLLISATRRSLRRHTVKNASDPS